MPHHVVERLAAALDGRGRTVSGATVLVLGLAYKRNIDDTRESPSLRLIRLVEARGARALYHDPLVPVLPPTREHPELAGRRSVPLTPRDPGGGRRGTGRHRPRRGRLRPGRRPRAAVVDTRNVMARHGRTDGAHIVKA